MLLSGETEASYNMYKGSGHCQRVALSLMLQNNIIRNLFRVPE